MRTKPQPPPSVDDDVRSSLDVLDRVIGEFDDGLLSASESEHAGRRHSRSDLRRSSEPEEKEEKIRPDIRGSRLSINEQIDDIFSELTEEIYNDDKLTKSEKRRIFDPLPSPPNTRTHPPPIDRKKKPGARKDKPAQKSQTMDNDKPRPGTVLEAKKSFLQKDVSGEVIVYNSRDRSVSRSGRVTVEIHNSSRDSISPPPKPEKQKIHLKNNSTERRGRDEDNGRGRGSSSNSRDTDQARGRQRDYPRGWDSENSRGRERSRGRDGDKNLSGQEAAMIQELKEKVSDKKGKISKFSHRKSNNGGGHAEKDEITRRKIIDRAERDNLDGGDGRRSEPSPSVTSPHSSMKSNQYESFNESDVNRRDQRINRQKSDVRGLRSEQNPRSGSRREEKDKDYRRSRSMGPIELRNESPERSERRSRSRGRRRDEMEDRESFRRSRSRGRSADPRSAKPESRLRAPADGSSRRSRSRGRSPSRPSEIDRSGKRSREGDRRGWREVGPPSPEEAQATLEKMLPRIPHGVPPERQRSMLDLRLTEELKRRNRRSMAGPGDDLSLHLRSQGPVPRNLGVRTDLPPQPFMEEQIRFHHLLNIDVQRDLLLRRGFPSSHPLVAGEIPIHPELLGHLHFDIPSRTTLPLGPEDFRRFLPEMQRSGMQSAFPLSTSDIIALQDMEKNNKVKRQKSYKETSFSSLQYEDMKKKKNQSRSQSTDGREKKFRPFSMFQTGAGWFNPGYVWREGGTEVKNKDKQWYMKEKNLQSLPPLGTTRDSGLGDDFGNQTQLSRGDKNRSSFGMILKDKFQKNPNMYFPDTRTPSRSPDYKTRKDGKGEDLSDTDTLIHNMSEGSFDKDSSLSGGRSVGSSKSNRSSGKSSLSHDSINGTPEMKRRPESITTPKTPNNTAIHLPSNPSIILNKKTIRNYTPKESSNMLRQFEEGRQSADKKGKSKKHSHEGSDIQRKSSMDKLIEDFHRNLPPLQSKDSESGSPFSDVDSMFSGSHLDNQLHSLPEQQSTQKSSKTGTVNSQTSNWSAASSVASFDYHIVSSSQKKTAKPPAKSKDSAAKRRMSQSTTNLSSLDEGGKVSPREERIPPEGAAADSPKQFVQRIEIKGDIQRKTNSGEKKPKPPRKTGKEAAREEVKDLLEADDDGDDELVMLKKLISEGRISGLNEKPPTFKPPTPPSKPAVAATKKTKAPAPKPIAPKTPEISKIPSGDRPRKNREAPAPPGKLKPPPETAEIKFISGRRIHSVEDLQAEDEQDWRGEREGRKDQRTESVQRSTSMHMTRDSRVEENDAVAKLIADSTEKKFKMNNIFKGMWKKKHYSFDLS